MVAKPRRYRCRQCMNSYTHRQGLWQHIEAQHGERTMSCEYCSFKAGQLGTIISHLREAHLEANRRASDALQTGEPSVARVEVESAGDPPSENVEIPQQEDVAVLSLSPTPMAELQDTAWPPAVAPSTQTEEQLRPTAPIPKVVGPARGTGGKPRAMLERMREAAAAASSSTLSSASSTAPTLDQPLPCWFQRKAWLPHCRRGRNLQ